MNFWLKDIIIYLRDSSLHNELMKMKTKHMRKRISYFKALRGLPKNELKKYIATCEDQLIHVICEACFNLCHHEILKDVGFEDSQKDALNDYLKILKDRKVQVQYKREILQKVGAEVVSLIHSNILPLLKEITKND